MKQHRMFLLTIAVLSAAAAQPAFADERHEWRGGGRGEVHREMRGGEHYRARGWGGERDIRHFDNRHLSVWRAGRWHHGSHGGRIGWWWIAAGTWYFYPFPIYPYPDPYLPPVVVVQPTPESMAPAAQAPAQNWYYCEASKSYYPYVSSCATGWQAVPATPAGSAP